LANLGVHQHALEGDLHHQKASPDVFKPHGAGAGEHWARGHHLFVKVQVDIAFMAGVGQYLHHTFELTLVLAQVG